MKMMMYVHVVPINLPENLAYEHNNKAFCSKSLKIITAMPIHITSCANMYTLNGGYSEFIFGYTIVWGGWCQLFLTCQLVLKYSP